MSGCYLCGAPLEVNYPNQVCNVCDARSLTLEGRPPFHCSDALLDPSKPSWYYVMHEGKRARKMNRMSADSGENPVFVDGVQCWRRYRFGGWVTMADPENHTTLDDFYGHHYPDKYGPDQDCHPAA